MNTMHKIALLAACSALCAGVAPAQDQEQETAVKPRPRREAMAEQRAAREAHRAEMLKVYDENGDGKLDDIERAVLREDVQSGKIAPPPRPPRGRREMGAGMRRQPPPEILAAYDVNEDGKLDQAEHEAVRADIESGKLKPPHRGEGPRGPRGPHGPRPDAEPDLEPDTAE